MKAPKVPSFFKFGRTNGPRQFTYTPRYYDEQKERIEDRKKLLNVEEKPLPDDVRREVMREKMRDTWDRRSLAPNNGFSVKRFVIILLVLCAGMYYLLQKYVL